MQLFQGDCGFLPVRETAAGQLNDLVLIGLDQIRFLLHCGNETASAGVCQYGDARIPAAADQAAAEIIRYPGRHAAADGDGIRTGQFPDEIVFKPAEIIAGDRFPGLKVFGGTVVRKIPAVNAAAGFPGNAGEGAADMLPGKKG